MSNNKNLEVFDEALGHIKANPDEWSQQVWRCQTGMCLAGHIAVTVDGGQLYSPWDFDDDYLVAVPEDDPDYVTDGKIRIENRARRLLGDAYVFGMFEGHNKIDDLVEYRKQAVANLSK